MSSVPSDNTIVIEDMTVVIDHREENDLIIIVHESDVAVDEPDLIVIDDDDDSDNNNSQISCLLRSKKQMDEWIRLVQKGMIRAPCTYCQPTSKVVLSFSVFINKSYQDNVSTLKLNERATDGSTHVVSIFGEKWNKPGLRGPLSRFRKHLRHVHHMSNKAFPKAISMTNQSTGLAACKLGLQAYKAKWRQMRRLEIQKYTRHRMGKGVVSEQMDCPKADTESAQLHTTEAEAARLREAIDATRLRISSWQQSLTQKEHETVQFLIHGQGLPPISLPLKCVTLESFSSLAPSTWLNDEVMTSYFKLIYDRDIALCQKTEGRRRSYIYPTHFFQRLLNEGHMKSSLEFKYSYDGVKSWSKRVPGKDIFTLDKIFFPHNPSRLHWNFVVAYIQEKRIEIYDSMGNGGCEPPRLIMKYIKDEHQAKKGIPLPNAQSWTLVTRHPTQPRQRNGKYISYIPTHLLVLLTLCLNWNILPIRQ